jgi:hypothetical protein
MKSIAIFCGSSTGNDPEYALVAARLGEKLAKKGIKIVYGGTKIGLMGKLADAALKNGGEVIGVIPQFLTKKELAHDNLTQLILVESMHERKIRMHEFSEGVIALPGGFGTMDEFFEMLTWGQLGLHKKPLGLLNVKGYYKHLNQFAEQMVNEGFLKRENKEMMFFANDIDALLDKFENYHPSEADKWIDERLL